MMPLTGSGSVTCAASWCSIPRTDGPECPKRKRLRRTASLTGARIPRAEWCPLAARGAFARSIREQLHSAGVDDLPNNGAFILAGIDTTGAPREDPPPELGATARDVSQLIDALVNRGYLTRGSHVDADGNLIRFGSAMQE
jgi:hypothetical protein